MEVDLHDRRALLVRQRLHLRRRLEAILHGELEVTLDMCSPGVPGTVQPHRGALPIERAAHTRSDWGVLDVVACTRLHTAERLVLRRDARLVEFALACGDRLVGAPNVTGVRSRWHVALEEHMDAVVLHLRRHLLRFTTWRTREQLHDLRCETCARLVRGEEPASEEGKLVVDRRHGGGRRQEHHDVAQCRL